MFPSLPGFDQAPTERVAFHDAYPEAGDFSVDESDSEQADFDIDSDASDADLLELKQELNWLGSEKAQRDLADATIAA